MALTNEQKGTVLWISMRAILRNKIRKPFDIMQRIDFNWPYLTEAERLEVKAGYEKARKEDMGTAKNPDKARVRCTLGWRMLDLGFDDLKHARLFIDEVLDGEKFKWKGTEKIIAKADDILEISSPELEEIMELDAKGTLPKHEQDQIEAFLRGQWPKDKKNPDWGKEVDAKPSGKKSADTPAAPKREKSGDMMSLQEICKDNGWEPKRARAALRKLGEAKSGRWEWGGRDVPAIIAKLKKAMK